MDPLTYRAHPKVLAIDPARFGDDFSVITLRQGLMVYSQVALSGFDGPDLASRVFEIVRAQGRVSDRGVPVEPAPSPASPTTPSATAQTWTAHCAACRACRRASPCSGASRPRTTSNTSTSAASAGGRMREWLEHGRVPNEDDLADQLTSLDFGYDGRFRIQLQSKKDVKKMGASPLTRPNCWPCPSCPT